MNYRTLLGNLQILAKELYLNKDKEIHRLTNNPKIQLWVIDLRKEEATKLKKLAEGLVLIESTGLMRMEAYMPLDRNLRLLTQRDPCLKGHIITLGPDKPELKPYFSKISYNIPITFYKP